MLIRKGKKVKSRTQQFDKDGNLTGQVLKTGGR
jgi:hypothetical protein